VLDIMFGCFVRVGPIDSGLAGVVLYVLNHLEVKVLLRTLVEGFDATIGPRCHVIWLSLLNGQPPA